MKLTMGLVMQRMYDDCQKQDRLAIALRNEFGWGMEACVYAAREIITHMRQEDVR